MDCIGLPFTRQENQSFGSQPAVKIRVIRLSQVPFYAFFAFFAVNLTSYWNERKAPETGVVPILSGYTLGFWRGREEGCQAQFL